MRRLLPHAITNHALLLKRGLHSDNFPFYGVEEIVVVIARFLMQLEVEPLIRHALSGTTWYLNEENAMMDRVLEEGQHTMIAFVQACLRGRREEQTWHYRYEGQSEETRPLIVTERFWCVNMAPLIKTEQAVRVYGPVVIEFHQKAFLCTLFAAFVLSGLGGDWGIIMMAKRVVSWIMGYFGFWMVCFMKWLDIFPCWFKTPLVDLFILMTRIIIFDLVPLRHPTCDANSLLFAGASSLFTQELLFK